MTSGGVSSFKSLNVSFDELIIDGVNILPSANFKINNLGMATTQEFGCSEYFVSSNYNAIVEVQKSINDDPTIDTVLEDMELFREIDGEIVGEQMRISTYDNFISEVDTTSFNKKFRLITENSPWRHQNSITLLKLPSFAGSVKLWDWDMRTLAGSDTFTFCHYRDNYFIRKTISNEMPLSDYPEPYYLVGQTENTLVLCTKYSSGSTLRDTHLLYIWFDENVGELKYKNHSLGTGGARVQSRCKVTDDMVGIKFGNDSYNLYTKEMMISDVVLLDSPYRSYICNHCSFYGNKIWVLTEGYPDTLNVVDIQTNTILVTKPMTGMYNSGYHKTGITCINEDEAWSNVSEMKIKHFKINGSDITITAPTNPYIHDNYDFEAKHFNNKWVFNTQGTKYVEDKDFTAGFTLINSGLVFETWTNFVDIGNYLMLYNYGTWDYIHDGGWFHKPVLINMSDFSYRIFDRPKEIVD